MALCSAYDKTISRKTYCWFMVFSWDLLTIKRYIVTALSCHLSVYIDLMRFCAERYGEEVRHTWWRYGLVKYSIYRTGCNSDRVPASVFICDMTGGDGFKRQVSQLNPSMTINHHNA